MNISRRGHNTCNGSVVHHVLAVIHYDNFSNAALPDCISEITHLSEPTESTRVKSLFQTCVNNVILVCYVNVVVIHHATCASTYNSEY